MRTEAQDRSLAERLEKKDKEFKTKIVEYIKSGRIIEFGCGSGAVLSILSEHLPKSIIVGLDVSETMLDIVSSKKLNNVTLVKADGTHRIFRDNIFDTALFIYTLHEIYSFGGRNKFLASLNNAYKILKENGRLIIWDSIKPEHQLVRMRFKNKATEEKFKRFVKEFKVKRINYKKIGEWVELDIADCLEFLTKYQHKNTEWETEMKETHLFIALPELKQILSNCGFEIEKIEWHTESKEYWEEKLKDVEVSTELSKQPKSYIIVASKGER
ncbi:MAG: methyltransferase domain-containing protein [Candidatus Thermoplasmatota archaeon]